MPVKDNLRIAIQGRRMARGLGVLNVSTEKESDKQENLTPQEEERRRLRRERNKQAANRCRKRKRDRIEHLEQTAREIEESNKALESDIAAMKEELSELMAVLKSHHCVMAASSADDIDSNSPAT